MENHQAVKYEALEKFHDFHHFTPHAVGWDVEYTDSIPADG